MMTSPTLSQPTIQAVNTLGQWLAQSDFTVAPQAQDADLIILAGNAVIPTLEAACEFAANSEKPLLIAGGIGHSTTYLYAEIARHPRYNTIPTTGRAEAAIIQDIAHQFWKVPNEKIITEEKSTNCGENARFSVEKMAEHGLSPERVLIIQDPTMQRRTVATFARVWQGDAQAPEWLSWPGVAPELVEGEQGTVFAGEAEGLWPIERYVSLALGEIPRLRDDATGYGPQGRDFIVHVDIPPQVMAAWHALQQDMALSALIRQRGL
ncbi:YdcF family protein [Cedecea sp. MMO-103]|uniref:YdcF family protein n=1 Tax=Cedecea sp. MMO-103 TaxID=3081238 RepID=UPI003018B63E